MIFEITVDFFKSTTLKAIDQHAKHELYFITLFKRTKYIHAADRFKS